MILNKRNQGYRIINPDGSFGNWSMLDGEAPIGSEILDVIRLYDLVNLPPLYKNTPFYRDVKETQFYTFIAVTDVQPFRQSMAFMDASDKFFSVVIVKKVDSDDFEVLKGDLDMCVYINLRIATE